MAPRAPSSASGSLNRQLTDRGFKHLHLWRRGVDLQRFRPGAPHPEYADLPRPIMAYMGRLASREEHRGFPRSEDAGYEVGDRRRSAARGASRPLPRGEIRRLTDYGEELGRHVGCADVLVFPSLTDTFGLAMIEALACGVPVAAFPSRVPSMSSSRV